MDLSQPPIDTLPMSPTSTSQASAPFSRLSSIRARRNSVSTTPRDVPRPSRNSSPERIPGTPTNVPRHTYVPPPLRHSPLPSGGFGNAIQAVFSHTTPPPPNQLSSIGAGLTIVSPDPLDTLEYVDDDVQVIEEDPDAEAGLYNNPIPAVTEGHASPLRSPPPTTHPNSRS